MEVVVEPIVSELFKGLFEILGSKEVRDFTRQLVVGVDSELEELKKKLMVIGKQLSLAEERQLMDEAVKEWLDDLRDWAYDAEDILDEFAYEALRRKLKAEHQTSTTKVLNLVPVCFSSSRFNLRMRSKIKGITSRLEQLCKIRSFELELQGMSSGVTLSNSAQQAPEQRTTSSSVPTEQVVYGRDEDKATILQMVKSDEPSDANFRVIAIVGMGGIGKTTLARAVYNDTALDIKFEKKVELQKAVNGKKIFLILDDVWDVDYNSWVQLKSPFMAGARGTEDCWNLFLEHAFGTSTDVRAHEIPDSIRKRVVQRCGGLPLAAKTLGGLLGNKQIDGWEKILNSEMWDSTITPHVRIFLKKLMYD